jgi:hypothetical protein
MILLARSGNFFALIIDGNRRFEMKRRAKTVMKNPHAVALGRLGGLVGGRVRAATLSARQRQAIARKAARARWSKQPRQRRA